MQRAFYDILDERRAAGRTIFFSSHVLSEVERVCDRVAIIRHGRLAAVEDVAGLLARRRRVVELRFDGDAPALEAVPGVTDLVVEPRPPDLPPGRRRRAVPGGHRRDDRARPDHRAGQPRGSVPRVLRRGRGVNLALFGHVWRANRVRLLIVAIALFPWGVAAADHLRRVRRAVRGDDGLRAHPRGVHQVRRRRRLLAWPARSRSGSSIRIAVGLNLVFALGFAASAVAGERQRGTLEVLLARPISRRRVYATLAVARRAVRGRDRGRPGPRRLRSARRRPGTLDRAGRRQPAASCG